MPDTDEWPADYFASRHRFVERARAGGARTDSRPVDAVGPRGEPLSVDTATYATTPLEHLIVLTSGVHGVEGFLGARVQMQAMRWLARVGVPDRTGVVMVHAVNPWGFAHLRRVDENNVDVNRNFVDPSLPRPISHPRYAALDPLINPREPPTIGGELRYWLRAGGLIVRDRGVANLSKAIAEGQYRFPRGLFFGGADVGESCRVLQDVVLAHAAGAERVTVLDVHSGLGPSAVATLIGNTNVGAPEKRSERLGAHYGLPVYLEGASGNAYDARGTFGQWCRRALSDKRLVYLCVEIGTVNPVTLFSALKRENQAHHWTAPGSTPYVRTKQALRDVFAPRSRRWRRDSVAQGLRVFERTFDLPVDLVERDR